jgi:hypothetical protein
MPPLRKQGVVTFGDGEMKFGPQTLPFDDQLTRVAKSICRACVDDPDAPGQFPGNQHRWQDYTDAAKAAIESH